MEDGLAQLPNLEVSVGVSRCLRDSQQESCLCLQVSGRCASSGREENQKDSSMAVLRQRGCRPPILAALLGPETGP